MSADERSWQVVKPPQSQAPSPASAAGSGRVKVLWVREPYLAQILSGQKTVEVRVGYDNVRRLQPGDRLKLNDEHPVTIRRVAHYADFEEMLAHENPAAIAPGMPGAGLLAAIRDIYPPAKEALGAVALEIARPPRAGHAYDAVLFDMGHTLVYFEPNEHAVVQEALAAQGHAAGLDEIRTAIQSVWSDYYQDAATVTFPASREYDHQTQLRLSEGLLAYFGLPTDRDAVQAYTDRIDALFGRPGALQPFPEVHGVLTVLAEAGYRLAIVSNWSWSLRERVTQAGLDGRFELVWASAYAGCNKPHPDIFAQTLARMDLIPDRALYVGDSYHHDVVGARNAGIEPVLVDRAGTAQESDCPVITDLWGVLDLL